MSNSRSPKKNKRVGLPNPKFPPPSRKAYCGFCKRETEWNLNRNTGHSCCRDCGSSSLYRGKDEQDVLRKLNAHQQGFNMLSLKED